MVGKIVTLVTALALGWSGAAFACQGKGPAALLDDSFKIPDPGWGPPDQAASFTSGGLVLKPPVNGSAWRWNQNYSIDSGNLCVEVVNPNKTGTDAGEVGLWFWSSDSLNFYTATLSLDGSVAIDRLMNGVWHVVMAPTQASVVRTQAGAVNEIEVLLKGNTGTLFVNGFRIGDFRGEAPKRGGPPGVYAESGKTATTWLIPRLRLF